MTMMMTRSSNSVNIRCSHRWTSCASSTMEKSDGSRFPGTKANLFGITYSQFYEFPFMSPWYGVTSCCHTVHHASYDSLASCRFSFIYTGILFQIQLEAYSVIIYSFTYFWKLQIRHQSGDDKNSNLKVLFSFRILGYSDNRILGLLHTPKCALFEDLAQSWAEPIAQWKHLPIISLFVCLIIA